MKINFISYGENKKTVIANMLRVIFGVCIIEIVNDSYLSELIVNFLGVCLLTSNIKID